ncbi:Ribonuclease P protein subunit p29 [Sarcoptes scabiei]|uniref:Ribonuclease P protein subunit p29 n=1 Tax=Sarcoptes scabiei TaxID=52283 RepID=A0A834VEG2_SARSC|nr:Ribonuclease P protein subunit p29 [Sarcoptes scabiei]
MYKQLPKAIQDVGHLINLDQSIIEINDEKRVMNLVNEIIPRKDFDDENFRYKIYSLYETIEREKSRRQSKRKCLNSKQRKALFDLKKEKFKFSDFDPINSLWHSYFDSVLNEIKTKEDQLKLARIDFHGCYLMVYSSKNVSIVGLKGYVLQESKSTFRLLTEQDRLLTIPKTGTVFVFEHQDKVYKLNGYNIKMSSFNRSKAKPKLNLISNL